MFDRLCFSGFWLRLRFVIIFSITVLVVHRSSVTLPHFSMVSWQPLGKPTSNYSKLFLFFEQFSYPYPDLFHSFVILRWAYIHLTEGDMGMLPCWCFFQCGDELNENLKLRCFGDLSLMFVFFTLWCSVKWNNLRCWSFLFYLSQI